MVPAAAAAWKNVSRSSGVLGRRHPEGLQRPVGLRRPGKNIGELGAAGRIAELGGRGNIEAVERSWLALATVLDDLELNVELAAHPMKVALVANEPV